ncbi:MAG: hypothetical protein AAF599_11475 [Bacteroidota bacterium]
MKKKGNKKKAKQQENLKQQLRSNWKAKAPVFLFLLGFLAFVIIFYIFYYSDWYRANLRDPLLNFQAYLGGSILKLLGYDVHIQDSLIAGDQFAINIKNGFIATRFSLPQEFVSYVFESDIIVRNRRIGI